MIILYNIFLLVYHAALHVAALWNPKARMWVDGRKAWRGGTGTGADRINGSAETTAGGRKLIWMHCASLGEFEQGRPLLEATRLKYPDYKILLTFFSPSGYEIRKNYTGADVVMYLPMDGAANARDFVNAFKPSLVLWVKYEYWHYYLQELKRQQIPVVLVSGIFRPGQPFFKWYGGFWKKILASFEQLFVQTAASKTLLGQIGFAGKAVVTGDTRFDRVVAIAAQWESLGKPVEIFCNEHPVLVAGSTWEEDEELLIHYARAYPQLRFIIAPHDVTPERIGEIKKEFPQAILYSMLRDSTEIAATSNVLIIDNIGTLSKLYKYATITYVGGGFNQSGIHNILEAAVYSKPVIFGPVYEKFAEAKALMEAGGAFSVENALELEEMLNELFNDEERLKKSSDRAGRFVLNNMGATDKILYYIQIKRLLTN